MFEGNPVYQYDPNRRKAIIDAAKEAVAKRDRRLDRWGKGYGKWGGGSAITVDGEYLTQSRDMARKNGSTHRPQK